MSDRDLLCVYVADDPDIADVMVTLLGHQGVEAQVVNPRLPGMMQATLWSKMSVPIKGAEVWVKNLDDAPRARQLIDAMQEQKKQRQQASEELGPVDAVCEDCGAVTTFPAKDRGTVQDCPCCGEYLDVPGGEEDDADLDWSGGDAEEPEN